MRFARYATTATVVIFSLISTPRAHSQAGAPAGPAKIAVANPSRIFIEIQETKDFVAKMQNDAKTFEAERLAKTAQVKELQQERDLLKPDAPQYADKDKKLMELSVEFETWFRINTARLERAHKMQINLLFSKIKTSVAKVATNKKIDIVIADVRPELPDLDSINENQLKGLLSQQNVLFNVESVDISTEVIATMDADYKAGR